MSAKASPSKQSSQPTQEAVAKALSHELRAALLRLMDREAEHSFPQKRQQLLDFTWEEFGAISPNVAAKVLGEPLTNVSYHVRMLYDLGCVEQVDTQPRRGALEHYYRALVRPAIAVEGIKYKKS